MVTKQIDLDTTSITLEELLTETQEPTEIILVRGEQPVGQLTFTPHTQPQPKKRVLGLHEGQGWISDDFTDPLPDEFWFGEDDTVNDAE